MEKSKRKVQFMDFCVQKFVKISLCKLKEELPESDAFFELVYHGDLKGVKSRQEGLEKDIQYIRDKAGWSLMHYAVLCGHVNLVKYFCKLGLDPNISCDVPAHGVKKWRPIHIAAETGNVELLRVLLEAGANAELFVEGRTSCSASRTATGSGGSGSANAAGAGKSHEADTINALGLAVLSQRPEAVRVLLEAGVFVEPRTAARRKTPLMLAAARSEVEIVRLLLQFGARVNSTTHDKGLTPLHYAAKGGHVETVKVLLEAHASPYARTTNGALPIHMAAFFPGARLRVLELLFEAAEETLEAECSSERDPALETPAYHQTSLVLAFLSKSRPKFDFLLDKGANINQRFDVGKIAGMNMLRYLVESRNVDLKMVDCLINNGIDINNVASDKMTPLMYATVKNLQPIVARLVAAGADPNFRDENGYTALILAVKQRYNALVSLILELKPNLDASIVFTDKKGNKYHECTALHLAVGKGNLEVTKQLVEAGADITTTMEASGERAGPDYGEAKVSCLHTAVVMNHYEIGKYLIEQGLDPNLTTSRGHTPLHYAASWGHADFAYLLITHGANVDAVADRNCSIPLHYAARANLIDMAELLLENGSNVRTVNAKGFTALHFALTFGHVAMAELLLRPKYGADVNIHSGVVEHRSRVSPLVLALEYCDVATVESLLRRGADPNAEFKANNMTLSPIFLCCEFGHVDKMKVLMKYGANINHQSSRGETPLHFALRFKRKEAAQLLIRCGANLDARASIGNGEMQQPIHVAAQVGLEELMPLMAQYGACVNSTMVLKSVERVTPLHLAALNDLQYSVRVLLELGADVNCKRSDTFTPLLTMVSKSNTEAVHLLLKAGAEVNAKCVVSRSKDATCLHIAAQVGIPDIINLLLRYGADVTARMTTGERSGILPIHLAAESGHLNVIERFLREGVSIDVQEDCGLTCLHYAANGGKTEIVRMLLERGANVALTATYDDGNRVDVMPLHMAAEKGFADCVRLLLDHGAPINATISRNRRSGITPLYLAVAENREEVVRVLVEYGADTNVQDSIGANPLHIACQRGYENMVFYLLTLGFAGVNVGTHNGATALHMVAEKGYTDLAAWLLRAGAAVNVRCLIVDVNTKKTSFNITPLNQACGFGHAKIVRMLLAAGADPYAGENFEGEDGITALHCAAIRGRVHIVPILVEAGVAVNVRDEKGNTPLHWAVRECFYDCCRVLIEHGADVSLRNKNGEKASALAKSNDILGLLRKHEPSPEKDPPSGGGGGGGPGEAGDPVGRPSAGDVKSSEGSAASSTALLRS